MKKRLTKSNDTHKKAAAAQGAQHHFNHFFAFAMD